MARRLVRPVRQFLDVEAAGGIVLLMATMAALILANTPIGGDIASFWEEPMTLLSVGDFDLTGSIGHWINDGLMAVFFFVVGLEIKRELVTGELHEPRRAALPAIAAIGGMAVPALLFTVFNLGGDGSQGWGIAMATDIAFAVGVMALLGDPRAVESEVVPVDAGDRGRHRRNRRHRRLLQRRSLIRVVGDSCRFARGDAVDAPLAHLVHAAVPRRRDRGVARHTRAGVRRFHRVAVRDRPEK
ncbi:hypothetical protein BH24ACT6_BH24ACT6_12490 [soil metagenome]